MASDTVHKKVHPNGQLSLGKEWGGRQVEVEFVGPFELRIRAGAVAFIPEEHKAFFTPEAMDQLAAFSDWEEKTPAAQTDLDEFRADIDRRRRNRSRT